MNGKNSLTIWYQFLKFNLENSKLNTIYSWYTYYLDCNDFFVSILTAQYDIRSSSIFSKQIDHPEYVSQYISVNT